MPPSTATSPARSGPRPSPARRRSPPAPEKAPRASRTGGGAAAITSLSEEGEACVGGRTARPRSGARKGGLGDGIYADAAEALRGFLRPISAPGILDLRALLVAAPLRCGERPPRHCRFGPPAPGR